MSSNRRPRRRPNAIVDDELGLVRFIAEVPQDPEDPKIFNYAVTMASTGEYLPLICFTRNGGAALTRDLAYRAALGETVERYCSSVFFKDDVTLKTYEEASRASRALAPDEIALFHPSQHDKIQYVAFDDETKICWAEAYSLSHKERVLVPATMVYLPYYPFYREEGEQTIGPGLSTGQASGYSYTDALLSGIYEVVERDAVSIFWLNRLPLRRIDIDSHPTLSQICRERFPGKNREWMLFDMTTDIAIPSVFCMMIDRATDPPMICTGGATHSSAERAATKALVETAQTLQWARYLGRREAPFIIDRSYRNINDFEDHVFLYAYGAMMPAVAFLIESTESVPLTSLPNASYASPAAELRGVRQIIERAGHEIVAADLTSEDVAECGYRVVKVIIPGMQQLEGDHCHRFLGGERLYQVPGRLGHGAKRHPDELNTDPHPYP